MQQNMHEGDISGTRVLIVYGPTGVGKTDFVDELAQQFPIEVINMDVGQLYTPLTIGTAKPDWRRASVPHHLFDVMDNPENYTVVAYRSTVLRLIQEIKARGATPVLVGGSSFYLKSLLFPVDVQEIDSATLDFSSQTTDALWEMLHTIDPVRAESIHKHDRYRIERAVAIWQTTGTKPSEYTPTYAPPFLYTLLFLHRERPSLYDRINKRVDIMLQEGWLDEVRGLSDRWRQFLLHKKLIGYNELVMYLDSAGDTVCFEKTVQLIKKRTRVYARKQEMYWRMLFSMLEKLPPKKRMDSHFELVNLTFIDLRLYLKQLKETFLRKDE